ncbi:hypothetical protein DSO57_1014401 [Entomophthora muscae]|uniref:Uncharacterized protein n=1 Tax=Entomophthora muscae TaxID=34485 RepID=A0ACC2UF20_9FUNG|nr:hypothetical protein DSO57_1014401 [Entomophthora muscae]
MRHVHVFFSLRGDDSLWCKFLGFFDVSLEHSYWYLNVCIALNMHLIVLLEWRPRANWELYYWACSFGAVVVVVFPLLPLDVFGRSNSGICYIRNGEGYNDMIEVLYYNLPSSLTICYCLVTSLAIIYKVNKQNKMPEIANARKRLSWRKRFFVLELNNLFRRLALYPVACFLANFGMNIHVFYGFINQAPNHTLYTWARAGFYSTGLLNLISFISDPIVLKEVREVFGYKTKPLPFNDNYNRSFTSSEPPSSFATYQERDQIPFESENIESSIIQFL